MIVMGGNYAATGKFDVEVRRTKEKFNLTKEEALNLLKKEYGR